ncbi:MAG: hypothetical protein ABJC09_06495 [Terriglobia bacterium]
MKKTLEAPVKISVTREDAHERSQSKEGREAVRRMAGARDQDVDTSDIPEVGDLSQFVRVSDHPEHPLYRALTQSVTIRLNAPDVAAARQLSKKKGLPYQTYIKMLLHEALQREMAK